MTIQLTPDQEQFIQAKVQTGQYRNASEVLSAALQLLAAQDETEESWLEKIRPAIEAAYSTTEAPVDGSTFIQQLRHKIRSKHQP